ncbi:MAG: c-type cytochrome [Acidimicrobiales bacterium]
MHTLLPLAAKRVGMSGQQTVAILILIVMFVGLLLFTIMSLTHRDPGAPVGSEVELAPNRKAYYDDDVLEGRRLDKALLFSLGMLVIVALSLPLYWLLEPTRQKGALIGFNTRSADRGALLFAVTTDPRPGLHFNCAGCHGAGGVGGSASFVVIDTAHPDVPPRQVSWSAPPLNTVLLRFTDQEVLQILTYGRAGTPMPAWGVAGGGAMDDQQLGDLIAYLHTIQLSKKDATAFWAARAATVARTLGSVDGAGNPVITGEVLFDANCARCHTKGFSYGEPQQQAGGGQYGPNLTGGSELRQFPAAQDQIDFVTNGVDPGKGYGTGGIMTDFGGGMPHFGVYLSPKEISEIVAYERSL